MVALGRGRRREAAGAGADHGYLASLGRDGRRKSLWRADDAAAPQQVSVRGEWVEVRLPAQEVAVKEGGRLILTAGDRVWDGRLRP